MNRVSNITISAMGLLVSCSAAQITLEANNSERLDRLVNRSRSSKRVDWWPAVQQLARMSSDSVSAMSKVWERAQVNTVGIKFVRIEPGTFIMGPYFENPFDAQWPHPVRIAHPYYISVTEITNAQFRELFPDWVPNKYSPDADSPATHVTWAQANAFCRLLSERERAIYRLPTEAEWEYACQGGTSTRYCFGSMHRDEGQDLLAEFAWWNHASERAMDVALLKPNNWGIYDMHGNAYEWVADWYSHFYYTDCLKRGIVADPKGPSEGHAHVLRGGAWNVENPAALTCTARMPMPVFDRRLFDFESIGIRHTVGFRIVREVDESEAPGTQKTGE